MAKARYLTKSRYKLARQCSTKLFYTGKKDTYDDQSLDDSFLQALAYGGFQVGELAKIYYPDGHAIETLDYDAAVTETNDLLTKEQVTIFEAAFRSENLFVRVDVLVKNGDRVQLIEVKSKSFDPTEENPFYEKAALKKGKKKIRSNWVPYIEDVAFQTYVARKAYPTLIFTPFLMMADKSKTASVDGLNQRFLLSEAPSSGRSVVKVKSGTNMESVGEKILCKICVSEEVQTLQDTNSKDGSLAFEAEISMFAKLYAEDKRSDIVLGSKCKSCQFRSEDNRRSGFGECWTKIARLKPHEKDGPFVFDVWKFRKSKELIASGIYLMKDIPAEMVSSEEDLERNEQGLTSSQRQWLQIEACAKGQASPYVDRDGLRSAIGTWQYPLHFIDFETTMVAIPFNRGRRPYEQVAFQFSHHEVDKKGAVVHKGQYLNQEVGKFPNFDFVRALKAELDRDRGTVFRYAAHENTVLCQIYDQLSTSNEPDRDELCAWIKTMTISNDEERGKWVGDRNMVDMCELVKLYYYHPLTNGSNSIKKVLPAVLQESERIKKIYSEPNYGTASGIPSLNFRAWQWVQFDEQGKVQDPYKLLPSILDGTDTEQLDLLLGSDEVSEGGAAMIAYAKMQFTEMSDIERTAITSALLRYCELDTLAMVMLWMHFMELTAKGAEENVA